MLTEKDLKTISNLLFTGKWNLSVRENNQTVVPLINKIARAIDRLKKGKDGKKAKNNFKKEPIAKT